MSFAAATAAALAAISLALFAAPASAADGEIPVGSGPAAVALSADGAHLYVTNFTDDTVSVVDLSSNAVTATIPVDHGPGGIAANPNGTTVFVTNLYAGTVSVISTQTNSVIDNIGIGTFPYGVTFNSDGTLAYVVKQGDNDVSIIDTATDAIVGDVPVGANPFGIAISPDGAKLYVTNQADDTVSVISTATRMVTATVPVGSNPFSVAFSADGAEAYITNIGSASTVSVIDAVTDSLLTSIMVPAVPVGIAVAPSGYYAYVALQNGTVGEIDTATNSLGTSHGTITLPTSQVGGLTINPAGSLLYVSDTGANTVSVRDLPVPPVITSADPPDATRSVSYSFAVTASGQPAPTYSIVGGALPAGLTLDSNTGSISGTPTASALSSTFTLAATNGVGPAVTATYTITVHPLVLATTGTDPVPSLLSALVLLAVGLSVSIGRRSARVKVSLK